MILAPPLIPSFFRYQKFCRTQKESSTKLLGTVRQKFLTEKRDDPYLPPSFPHSIPPSLLSIIFIDIRVFLEHRRVPLPSLVLLGDNKVSKENRDIAFSSTIFWIHQFSDTLLGSATTFFGTVRQQIFYNKL